MAHKTEDHIFYSEEDAMKYYNRRRAEIFLDKEVYPEFPLATKSLSGKAIWVVREEIYYG
jgi:hypothetical protein